MVERRLTAWLRSALALFGIAGILLLAGCGGGSGAPNNPYAPPPPVIPPLIAAAQRAHVYPGTPATLTVSGRRRPLSGLLQRRQRPARRPRIVSGDTIVLAANTVTVPTTVVASRCRTAAGTVSAAGDDQRAAGAAAGDAASRSLPTRTRRAPGTERTPLLRRYRHGHGEGHRQRRRRESRVAR